MKSSFTISHITLETVFIIDNDDGHMSVTNDAEAVVQHLNSIYPNKRIVYKDTEGEWTELLHINGRFTAYKFYRDNSGN